MIFIICD